MRLVPMRTTASRICMIVAGATFVAGSGFAQTTTPNNTIPDANPPAQNLSKELNQSNGVIHPNEVDTAIQKPAPATGDPNVVAPPGTSGGAAAPQPK
jgi:hypothetical protein